MMNWFPFKAFERSKQDVNIFLSENCIRWLKCGLLKLNKLCPLEFCENYYISVGNACHENTPIAALTQHDGTSPFHLLDKNKYSSKRSRDRVRWRKVMFKVYDSASFLIRNNTHYWNRINGYNAIRFVHIDKIYSSYVWNIYTVYEKEQLNDYQW